MTLFSPSRIVFASLLVASTFAAAQQAPVHIAIDPANIVHPVSPMMYGLMTEEINHSYEGGLYAEMVSNDTFRGGWMGTESWGIVRHGSGSASAAFDKTSGPSAAITTSLKVTVAAASPGNEAGLTNPGYWGMAILPHTTYKGSFYAKLEAGDPSPVIAQLVSDTTGSVLASAKVDLKSGPWQQYTYTLTSGAAAASQTNHLEILFQSPVTVGIQLASLFPPTYQDVPNGNRIDLMQKLADMHPAFIRLPGGNYLEGDRLEDWYNWEKTIGPLVDRPGHQAPWSYWSDDHFGFLEFLEWTEQLHAEPILAVYAGYSLRHDYIKPGKALEPFVQSALDEVEYVTGDTSTKWGAERAKDGHPAPFPLHFIEIGNEDDFDKSGSYDARFAQFALALRAKYPQYKLIATTPVKEAAAAAPDIIDDHYYKSPEDMFALVHHYDDAPRTGPKVFVGEWATRSGSPTPNFADTLGDAAWMTAMERNSDLILMASYAPLLVNVNPGGMQWPTDLIGYDSLHSYGSPSFYAQSLFAEHLGDGQPKSSVTGAGDRFFYSVTESSKTHTLHLKLVNATSLTQPVSIDLNGLASGAHTGKVISLHGATYQETNSITDPERIKPTDSVLHFTGSTLTHAVPPLTIQIIDIPVK
jgi:alpha-N-arabinofuranosidase